MEVDWDANDDAFHSFPQLFRLWASKHVSGWCGVNSMRFAWKDSETHSCPHCNADHETTAHLPVCPAPKMQESWVSSITGLEVWLTMVDTHPDIQSCLLATLRERTVDASFITHSLPSTTSAALSQDRIGWINLVEGKISQEWRTLQDQHYRNECSRRTARRWAEGLVVNLLEVSHSQWIQRNGGLYELATNGLPVAEAAQLVADITAEHSVGATGLRDHDLYLIRRPLSDIISSPAIDQQRWLQTIRFARQSLAEAHTSELGRMRTNFRNWLQTATL